MILRQNSKGNKKEIKKSLNDTIRELENIELKKVCTFRDNSENKDRRNYWKVTLF